MKIRLIFITVLAVVQFHLNAQSQIEKWSVFELKLNKSETKNVNDQIHLSAKFFYKTDTVSIKGFYNGNGEYKIRFMPYRVGTWNYITQSNQKTMIRKGHFNCVEPSGNNHGPVQVADTFNFSYSDGKPYYPMGTTIYRWLEQKDSIQMQTIETLKNSPFNKARFKILGPGVDGITPAIFPFEEKNGTIDYSIINPDYFKSIDKGIVKLREIGVEADLIFLHPYDEKTLPLDEMTMGDIYHYLDYIIARFGAYRNVWWTTNEFDLLRSRTMDEWDNIFVYLQSNDPYHHLRSCHNSFDGYYDNTKQWITHLSIQSESWWESQPFRQKYLKPVIFDEFCYEGNGDDRTIALNGHALTHRLWQITVNGGFGTHGEALVQPETGLRFFSEGGKLVGISAEQLKVLKKVIDESPGPLKPIGKDWRLSNLLCGVENKYYVYYFGDYQINEWRFTELPENVEFHAKLVDTQTGKIVLIPGKIKMDDTIKLPGKPNMAMVLKL